MTLHEQLALARANEQRLAEARAKAWDLDPGNLGMVHNFYGPYGYHEAFKAWVAAKETVAALEKKLAEQEVAA